MRRIITTTATAALAAGALLVASGGAAQAAKTDTSMSVSVDRAPLPGADDLCQYVVTMQAGTPSAAKDYVYVLSDTAVEPGKKNDPFGGAGVTTTSGTMVFTLSRGSTFAFAAYGEYSNGKHTVVTTWSPETVSC